jgi:hypothetical protein
MTAIVADLPPSHHAAVSLRAETHPELFSQRDEALATGVAYHRQHNVPGVATRPGRAIESSSDGTAGRSIIRRSASRPSAQQEQGVVQ